MVTDAEMAALNIQPAVFYGEWNYTIGPRRQMDPDLATECRGATVEDVFDGAPV